MISKSSLRFRLIAGASLWGAGTICAAAALVAVLLRGHLDAEALRRMDPNAASSRLEAMHPWINSQMAIGLGVVATGLLVAGIWAVARGFRPFADLRLASRRIRSGEAREITGDFPSEIRPLVDDLNGLLEQQSLALVHARKQAASLAHGLKTPLAAVANEISSLRGSEREQTAETLDRSVEIMREQIERHLARARAAPTAARFNERCDVSESIERLRRTMDVLYRDRRLVIETRSGGPTWFNGDRADFEEMAGNLVDNACKWARSSVVIRSRAENGFVVVDVEDDGPGFDDRPEEPAGLGLSIVRDLAGLYGGHLELGAAGTGGRTTLQLPGG